MRGFGLFGPHIWTHQRHCLLAPMSQQTNISVLLIVGPKCTLAASHTAPWRVTKVRRRNRQTDRRTLDASVMITDWLNVFRLTALITGYARVDGRRVVWKIKTRGQDLTDGSGASFGSIVVWVGPKCNFVAARFGPGVTYIDAVRVDDATNAICR